MIASEQIKKIVLVGGSTLIKTMASFILRVSGRGQDLHWVSSRDEAVTWLKGDAHYDEN